MSRHWQFCINQKELIFKAWLKKHTHTVINLPEGWAKKSGTVSPACIVILDKPKARNE
jgi:hypothetical protein